MQVMFKGNIRKVEYEFIQGIPLPSGGQGRGGGISHFESRSIALVDYTSLALESTRFG